MAEKKKRVKKDINTKIVEKKKIRKAKKELKMVSEGKKEAVKARKFLYALETIAIIVIAFLMIVLLLNKTFFKEEYVSSTKNGDFKIEIPLLYYFVSDEDNVVTFKTLRKSTYDEEFRDKYLNSLTKYDCKNESFYYDENYNLAIYKYTVTKGIAIKTIQISYDIFDIKDVCN